MARAEREAPVAAEAEKLIEVKLIRKYVPRHLYDVSEPNNLGERIATPKRDDNGNLIDQKKILLGEKDDRFGRKVPVYQEVLTAVPAGTIIPLPADEAKRALSEETRIAATTARTFG